MDISKLNGYYEQIAEQTITERRFKYNDFCQVIGKHFEKKILNFLPEEFSFEKRKIFPIMFGKGKRKVLIFTQMHGNEPISTLALLDFLNFLEQTQEYQKLVNKELTLIIIPLLNPDGLEKFDRRNAQGIDINRDAKTLISPEARILDKFSKQYNFEFALNIHDMELYYTSKPENLQTSLAMLAPECNENGDITPSREKSMKVISEVFLSLESLAKNRIAKYSDKFTPEAFGDTLMERGTSSILLEAGAIFNDKERLFARKVVFLSIVKAVESIATESFKNVSKQIYFQLPENIRYNAFDLIIKNLTVKSKYENYTIDLGIRRIKPTFNPEDFTDDFQDYRILNIGKLDKFGAINSFDASNYILKGDYSEIFIGRKADFEISSTQKNEIINIKSLL